MSDTVTITKKRHTELINTERWMNCLEAAGIDNAEAYSYAYEIQSEDPEAYGEIDEEGELVE